MQMQFFEIYRAGLKSTADLMEEQARSVRELAGASSPEELMALQTRLAERQLQRAMDLWSQLWGAAADNPLALIGEAHARLGSQLARLREDAPPEQRAA